MMARVAWLWFGWLGWIALAAASGEDAPRFVVSGRVVDAAGKPVAGVELALQWSVDARGRLVASNPVQSGPDGSFSAGFRGYGDRFAVVAYDKARLRGAVLVGRNGERRQGVRLELAPTVDARIELTSGSPDRRPKWARCQFRRADLSVPSITHETTNGRIRVRLPRGDYAWEVFDRDFVSRKGNVTLGADGRGAVNLGVVDLAPPYLARMEGKVLPEWKVTAARGLPLEKASLRALRGRWILVEFWGFW